MNRRFLVTGASGFIGRHVTARLSRLGRVHAVSRRPLDTAGIETTVAGLSDRAALAAVLGQFRPTAVVHLAAAGVTAGASSPSEMIATNVVGTRNLLSALEGLDGLESVVTVGSWFEYGSAEPGDPPAPTTPYGMTKLASSMLALAARADGLRTVVLRPFQVYGPGEPAGRLIPAVLQSARDGRALVLRHPSVKRDWVFVDDVADAIVRATGDAGAPGPFDVGTGHATSVGEAARLAAELAGAPAPVDAIDAVAPGDEGREGVADTQATARGFGWSAAHNLAEGLRVTVDHWREAVSHR